MSNHRNIDAYFVLMVFKVNSSGPSSELCRSGIQLKWGTEMKVEVQPPVPLEDGGKFRMFTRGLIIIFHGDSPSADEF